MLEEKVVWFHGLCTCCFDIVSARLESYRQRQREVGWEWQLKKVDMGDKERKRAIAYREAIAAQYGDIMPDISLDEVLYRLQATFRGCTANCGCCRPKGGRYYDV